MPKGLPKEQSDGNSGESAVMSEFQRWGWGALHNAREDIGTDLLIMARSNDGISPELLMGAQVKTGPSYFTSPTNKKSDEEGWWYRDKQRTHVDDWVEHPLPHLLILHDLETRKSYWAHVTAESIVSTGKGAKVLVPRRNEINEESRDALLRVAESIGAGWDGSAWRGAAPRRKIDQLRYAMIVPRIIAPHQNRGQEDPISPAQGLAMIVQGRLREYENFAKKYEEVPDVNAAKDSDDWHWRFVHAMAQRIENGNPEFLQALIEEAPNEAARVAAGVATACALLDVDELDKAVHIIESESSRGSAEPIDEAWLAMQRSRLYLDIGKIDEARSLALEAQQARAIAPGDLTLGAIAGAGANLIFNTTPWQSNALATAISAGDTPVAWWRNQTVSRGLGAVADQGFKAWALDESVRVAAEDVAQVQLSSAATLSSHAADHGGWRRMSSVRGQARLSCLDRNADADEVGEALTLLVRGGDYEAIKLAVAHLISDGPSASIEKAAEGLNLEAATHTTAMAELRFLGYGGAALGEEQADRAVSFLLGLLLNDRKLRAYEKRTSPTFWVAHYALEALSEVIQAASLSVQRRLIGRLPKLPPQKSQRDADAWARLIDAVPEQAWTKKNASAVLPEPRKHHASLQIALEGVASKFDPKAKVKLVAKAKSGSRHAVSALGDVTLLSKSAAAAQIDSLSKSIESQIDDARQGSFQRGSFDLAELLVVLNAWHPEVAQWDVVMRFLEDSHVLQQQKYRAIVRLADLAPQIPEGLRQRLGEASVKLVSQGRPRYTLPFWPDRDPTGPATVLAIQIGAIDLESNSDPLVKLLAGDYRSRLWAAHAVTNRAGGQDIGVLATLSNDDHPSVRASSASGLAYLVAQGNEDALVVSALEASCADPGNLVPRTVAETLRAEGEPTEVALELLRKLEAHPSPHVRSAAAR